MHNNTLPYTKLLRTLLTIEGLFAFIHIFTDGYLALSYGDLLNGRITLDDAQSIESSMGVLGLPAFAVIIVTRVVFLMWIYNANRTLHYQNGELMAFSPAGSIGWYFAPILNLFKPYQAMKEIWDTAHKSFHTTWILPAWWALWLISNLFSNAAFRMSMDAKTIPDLQTAAFVTSFSNILDTGLIVVAYLLVTSIQNAYATNYTDPLPDELY